MEKNMNKIGARLSFVAFAAMQIACTVDAKSPGVEGSLPGQREEPQPPAKEEPAKPPTTDPMAPPPQPQKGMAMLRAIHASADAPMVDVYVKGSPKPIVTNLAYGQTSGWFEVAE